MQKSTTESTQENLNKNEQENLPLREKLVWLLNQHRPAFNQERVYWRVIALVFAELFAFGRHTVTQLLLTLGIVDDDWSGWYRLFSRGRFNEEAVNEVLTRIAMEQTEDVEPFVIGVDGFQVPRKSKTMPGTGWLPCLNTAPFKQGIERAQRYVEGSWLTPMVNGFSRAIPIRCIPAFPPKAEASDAPSRKEWEAGLQIMDWVRRQLDRCGRAHQGLLVVADASFDTLQTWLELPERTWLLVRTKRNRALYYLPKQRKMRGRPRDYGYKARPPHAWLKKRRLLKRFKVTIRNRERTMRYRVCGPFIRDGAPKVPLFLIIVGGQARPKGSRRQRYAPCYYLVSAVQDAQGRWRLPLTIDQLLPWLWQRWELEVAHRNMKSILGLGEKQCWNSSSTYVSVQWSAWVYGLLNMAGHLAWGLNSPKQPPGRWRKTAHRWSFNTLLRGFRAELWQTAEFQASCVRSLGNWPKKESLVAHMHNAILASARA